MFMHIQKWKYYDHSQMEGQKEQENNWDEYLSVSQAKLVDQIKRRGAKTRTYKHQSPTDEAADLHTK
jgi:hypothetical protein